MNKREKMLAIIVGSAMVLLVGRFVLTTLFLGPLRGEDQKIEEKKKEIDKKEQQLNARNRLIRDWRNISEKSLSDDPEIAYLILSDRMTTLINEAGLQNVQQRRVIDEFKNGNYHRVAMVLSGRATLQQIVKFLELFYQEPYLVKVTGMMLNPEGGSGLINFSSLRIETMVPGVPEVKTPPLTTRPVITATDPPLNAASNPQYAMIPSRNIFQPKAPPPPPPPPTTPPQTVSPTPRPAGPPGTHPGDIVGTTVIGTVRGAYIRNRTGIEWYKVSDQLENQMIMEYVHPLGIVVRNTEGKLFYAEIGHNINRSEPFTLQALPELYKAYQSHVR